MSHVDFWLEIVIFNNYLLCIANRGKCSIVLIAVNDDFDITFLNSHLLSWFSCLDRKERKNYEPLKPLSRNCNGEPKHYYIFIAIFVTNWLIHNVINSCKQWKNTPSKLQWAADTKTLINTVSFIWWRISRWNYFLTFGKFNLVFISIYLFIFSFLLSVKGFDVLVWLFLPYASYFLAYRKLKTSKVLLASTFDWWS